MTASEDTWQAAERDHFRERLESFVDVVFGLSLSLSASSLAEPHRVASPTDLIGFAFTFASIATFWVLTHRVLARAFVVNRASVAAIFVLLCGVALFPAALSALSGGHGVPTAVLERYDLVFAAIMGGLGFAGIDGFLRSGSTWEPSRRRAVWHTAVRQAVATIYLLVHSAFLVQIPSMARASYIVLAVLLPASRVVPIPSLRRATASSNEA